MQAINKTNKSDLRSDFMKQLKNVKPQQQVEWNSSITLNLKTLLVSESGYWGAYQALKNEPLLNWSEVSSQINWCFPETDGEQIIFKSHVTQFKISDWGVLEPIDGQIVETKQLNGVVVPGLAFSEAGFRLGRGKAFYDKSLASFKSKKIGVCYELSFVKDLPSESHDILFHHIVTESSIYQVAHSEGVSKWN